MRTREAREDIRKAAGARSDDAWTLAAGVPANLHSAIMIGHVNKCARDARPRRAGHGGIQRSPKYSSQISPPQC